MNLTSIIVSAGCGSTQLRAAQWVSPIQSACDHFGINTPQRIAAFLANVGVESARLTAVVEDLSYSAEGLLSTFPSHFDAADAQAYAYHPQRIASRAYANRNGNGDEASGDGWTYRGRALLEITGRRNYQLCGLGIGADLISHPELLEQMPDAALAAAWWWSTHGLNALADAGNFLGTAKTINLGSATAHGTPGSYSQRLALYGAAKKALGIGT